MEEKHLCAYGCGQEAKFQLGNKKWCCSESQNSCPELRKKNSSAILKLYSDGVLNAKENYHKQSDESKLKQVWNRGKTLFKVEDVFKKNSHYTTALLKKYIKIFSLLKQRCDICGIETWNNKEIVFECHHIDGDKTNNILENLQLLCPNCHSQTNTFRGRNINGKRENFISDEKLLEALKNHKNIRRALMSLGLAAKGGNYYRATNLLNKENNKNV